MLFLIALTLFSTICFVLFLLTRNNDYWKKQNVSGPTPEPFFGNFKKVTLRKALQLEVLKDIYNQYPDEKIVGIYRMKTPALLIRDLDIIKHVLIKDFDDFTDRGIKFDEDGMGANLFHADSDRWQVLRNKFTPIFTSGKLKNMFHLITARGDNFIDHVKNICPEKSDHNIYELIQKYTVCTISACAFGLDIDMNDSKISSELHEINNAIFKLTRAFDLDMMFPGILNYLSASIFPKLVKNFFSNLSKNVIEQRNGKPTNRKDFMDLILELRQQKQISGLKRHQDEVVNVDISDGVIAAQCFVFYAGGYETSATTMTFLLYELAKNPDVQEKVIEEIDEVLKTTNGEVTYDCLSEMTYLTQVFDETLRLYPIVEIQRVTTTDYKIPGTEVVLEKGRYVLINALGIHMDKKYYDNPEKFDPERFTPENSGKRHPCAYMPFGLGPRNCIGMRFAKVQSRVCIVKLLSNFRVETSENTIKKVKYDPNYLIMSPVNGIRLNLVPRVK